MSVSASTRLIGLDLFRAVAVFGMLVAHVGPSAWMAGAGFGDVHPEWEIFHSRMPAMFAFAAGLSLNLSASGPGGDRPAPASTLIRSALLAVIGIALTLLGTPVAVILTFFAAWFVLVLPFRRWRARALLVAALTWAILGPLASFLLRLAFGSPDNAAWDLLVGGDYPAMTWMPFVLAGLAVGRMDLTAPRLRRGLMTWGGVLLVVGYAIPALVLTAGGAAQIMNSLPLTRGRDAQQQFAAVFFSERGVTDLHHWLWLVAPAPHSGSWGDVLGCLGVCAVLLSILLRLGDAAEHARGRTGTCARTLVSAIAPLGAMVLSVYAAHIVLMAVITATTGHSFRGGQSPLMLTGFTVVLAVFSALWMRRFRRGPLEWALGRAGAFIERTGRRVSAGWSRR